MGIFRDERDDPLEFELGDTYEAVARIIRTGLEDQGLMQGERKVAKPPELGMPYGGEKQ